MRNRAHVTLNGNDIVAGGETLATLVGVDTSLFTGADFI